MKNLLAELERTLPEEGKIVSKAAERIATFAACRGAGGFIGWKWFLKEVHFVAIEQTTFEYGRVGL